MTENRDTGLSRAETRCPGPSTKLTQRPIWNEPHTRKIGRLKVFYKVKNGNVHNCVHTVAFDDHTSAGACLDVRNDGRDAFGASVGSGHYRVNSGMHNANGRCIKWTGWISHTTPATSGRQASKWRYCD